MCWACKELKKVGLSSPVYLKIPTSRNRLLISPITFYCILTQYVKIRNNPTMFTKRKWITNSLLIFVSCNVHAKLELPTFIVQQFLQNTSLHPRNKLITTKNTARLKDHKMKGWHNKSSFAVRKEQGQWILIRPALGPNKLSIQWVPGGFFPRE